MPKEYSEPCLPLEAVEEMEVEMILLNLTEEILENAVKEGREVVVVEMNPETGVEEAVMEADLIQQAMQAQSIQGHYRTK